MKKSVFKVLFLLGCTTVLLSSCYATLPEDVSLEQATTPIHPTQITENSKKYQSENLVPQNVQNYIEENSTQNFVSEESTFSVIIENDNISTEIPTDYATQTSTNETSTVATESLTEPTSNSETENPVENSSEETTITLEASTKPETLLEVNERYGICTKNVSIMIIGNDRNIEITQLYTDQRIHVINTLEDLYLIQWYDSSAYVCKDYVELFEPEYVPTFEAGTWVGCITN